MSIEIIIPVSEVKFHSDVSSASPGALLQIAGNDLPAIVGNKESRLIGMLCERPSQMGLPAWRGMVLLEGDGLGVLLDFKQLSYRPALDVSKLARIILQEPGPFNNYAPKAGDIFQVSVRANRTFLGMAIKMADDDQPTVSYYLELGGEDTARGAITPADRGHYVGRAAVAPSRQA